ncbi:uncharacterized protein AKAW2_20015A [Aspergillus luchuensis]|uniref:Uncharacterized protein n=1 Tax=Aspergillus kawachii TaxID=1069201 RepID=A0A7R7ZUH9_ASPKA|nr:uncharacterized protein AKAW2_20015A [Aspergillus luchuensis]BCR95075.1 hypothetical protein AKAW2_20015A [Aspergillus luchuensis]
MKVKSSGPWGWRYPWMIGWSAQRTQATGSPRRCPPQNHLVYNPLICPESSLQCREQPSADTSHGRPKEHIGAKVFCNPHQDAANDSQYNVDYDERQVLNAGLGGSDPLNHVEQGGEIVKKR